MARITRAAPHLWAEDLKTRMKREQRPWCRERWLILYHALVDPREASEIATHCATTAAMVHQVMARSHRLGVAPVETPGKGGRPPQSMRWEGRRAGGLSAFFPTRRAWRDCHRRHHPARF